MNPGRPARRFRPRAVVTDVDGTLTDRERRLRPEALDAVRRVEARGIPVVLATGNVLPIALSLRRFLGLSGPIVAENGGLIFEEDAGPPRVRRLANPRIALRAYRELVGSGLPVRRLFTDRWRETEVALEPSVALADVRRVLKGWPLTIESTGFAIHLMAAGCGKLPALKQVLEPLGLTPRDCVILGDGDNDVAMLRAAGFGVSFASASARARAAADRVTRSSYAAGFLEGLKAAHLLG
jgi:phosphoglycolate phosphatase (TIGR01487 family)